MLECVVNVSEGRRPVAIQAIASAAGDQLVDVHSDPWHNRSVLTLAGPDVEEAARSVAAAAVELLDLAGHEGAHPRLGVVDVVPFVPVHLGTAASGPVDPGGSVGPDLDDALEARERFAGFAASVLEVPCFYYGPERSLPEVRRRAFVSQAPDVGPPEPHPSAGAICVGARDVLVAYNLWLAEDAFPSGLDVAKAIARSMRRPGVRALGLALENRAQVSCNLLEPWAFGPSEAFDFVSEHAQVERAELVGLVPESILRRTPEARWAELDLAPDRTIEARLPR